MGPGDDVAESAGSAEVQPATYTGTLSPAPPICPVGMKTLGVWGQGPQGKAKKNGNDAQGRVEIVPPSFPSIPAIHAVLPPVISKCLIKIRNYR